MILDGYSPLSRRINYVALIKRVGLKTKKKPTKKQKLYEYEGSENIKRTYVFDGELRTSRII